MYNNAADGNDGKLFVSSTSVSDVGKNALSVPPMLIKKTFVLENILSKATLFNIINVPMF